MKEPKNYRKKPEPVEAMSFRNWGDAIAIWKWSGSRVLYVPEGAEHGLRKQSEYDRSTGVLAEGYRAPAFLVVSTCTGEQRADHGDWIIQDTDGHLSRCSADIFQETYEEVTA